MAFFYWILFISIFGIHLGGSFFDFDYFCTLVPNDSRHIFDCILHGEHREVFFISEGYEILCYYSAYGAFSSLSFLSTELVGSLTVFSSVLSFSLFHSNLVFEGCAFFFGAVLQRELSIHLSEELHN